MTSDLSKFFVMRLACRADVPFLAALIELSVRTLQAADYSPLQIEGALAGVFGVDTQLIEDGTYYVVHSINGELAGCGGWSRRKTLFGGDHATTRDSELLDPASDSSKIRAFFVHPQYVRRGIGAWLLEACEAAARREGFLHFEMGATLTGVPLYKAKGYSAIEDVSVALPNGEVLPIVRMRRSVT